MKARKSKHEHLDDMARRATALSVATQPTLDQQPRSMPLGMRQLSAVQRLAGNQATVALVGPRQPIIAMQLQQVESDEVEESNGDIECTCGEEQERALLEEFGQTTSASAQALGIEGAGGNTIQRQAEHGHRRRRHRENSNPPTPRRKRQAPPRAIGAPCSADARACYSISGHRVWLIVDGRAIDDFKGLR